MAHKRALPRTALTREQIHAMSDEDLAARIPEREMKVTANLTRLSFDKAIPKKLETESTGEYRRRVRESKEIDKEEFARSLRVNAEGALYNSQKKQRMLDALASTITPESIEKRKQAEAARAQRDRERDLEGDGFTAGTYAAPITATWEPK